MDPLEMLTLVSGAWQGRRYRKRQQATGRLHPTGTSSVFPMSRIDDSPIMATRLSVRWLVFC